MSWTYAVADVELPECIDEDAVGFLRRHLLRLANHDEVRELVVDGSGVQTVSAEGLGVIVAAAILTRRRGGRLVISRPSMPLQRRLRIVDFGGLLHVRD